MIGDFERRSRMDYFIDSCNHVLEFDVIVDLIMYKNEAKRLQSKFPNLDIQNEGNSFPMNEGKSLYRIKKKGDATFGA